MSKKVLKTSILGTAGKIKGPNKVSPFAPITFGGEGEMKEGDVTEGDLTRRRCDRRQCEQEAMTPEAM